jgi:hypothetical protein
MGKVLIISNPASVSNCSNSLSFKASKRVFHTDEFVSVWYRCPGRIYDLAGENLAGEMTSPQDRHLVEQETNATLWGFYGRIDALWISHPYNMQRAAWKPFQLEVASRVGFRCPQYVISNDQSTLQEFASSHKEMLMKTIYGRATSFEPGGRSYSIYVKKPIGEQPALFPEKPMYPVLLQEYIKRSMDVRVTMIGLKMFSVAFRSANGNSTSEFQSRPNLPHEVIECPDVVRRSIIAYAGAFGLNFAAFDFAVADDGTWYFLDCDPNGQWLWLETLTGLPMVETLARHLALIEGCFTRGSQVQA